MDKPFPAMLKAQAESIVKLGAPRTQEAIDALRDAHEAYIEACAENNITRAEATAHLVALRRIQNIQR